MTQLAAEAACTELGYEADKFKQTFSTVGAGTSSFLIAQAQISDLSCRPGASGVDGEQCTWVRMGAATAAVVYDACEEGLVQLNCDTNELGDTSGIQF